jgi:hypothetical protein
MLFGEHALTLIAADFDISLDAHATAARLRACAPTTGPTGRQEFHAAQRCLAGPVRVPL